MYYKIDEILSSVDVYSVFNDIIPLKETRNGYLASCPFHIDKTPSFFLNSYTKRYYCFSCHKKGNILTFVMEYKNWSFKESLMFLFSGYKFKYTIPKSFLLINLISDIYFKNLKKNYFLNKNLRLFLNKRQINISDIDMFQLGFSENSLNWLTDILFKLGYSFKHLSLSGLFFLKNGYCSDRFRNRIVFPIRNIYGQIIAFGGRSLNDKIKPKYINSSETSFFSKRHEIYGLYESFNAVKSSTIVVVEGYIDVITLHKYGIKYVAAILGTAFTKEHFKKISSMYKNIIFCYDGDHAGRTATERTAFFCLQYLQYASAISFILLPIGHDPDSFIKNGFKNKFLHFLKKPIYILDLVLNRLIVKINCLDKDDLRSFHFFTEVVRVIDKFNNLYFKKVLFFYFFKKFFEYENIIFDYTDWFLSKGNNSTPLSGSLRASYFLLNNRHWVLKIDINRFLWSKNLDFFSDINIFFEILILIKRNKLINLKKFDKISFNDITFSFFHSYNGDTDEEFQSLLDKIYKSC